MNTKKELALKLITSIVKDCDDESWEMLQYTLLDIVKDFGHQRQHNNAAIVNQVCILLEAIKDSE